MGYNLTYHITYDITDCDITDCDITGDITYDTINDITFYINSGDGTDDI